MSLTSQLKKPLSPVRTFFESYESSKGLDQCFRSLKDRRKPSTPEFCPKASWIYSVVGTVVDYLIRYEGNGCKLDINSTIAAQTVKRSKGIFRRDFAMDGDFNVMFDKLLETGKSGLNGSKSTSRDAIFSATALAILDRTYFSFRPQNTI